MIFMIFFVVEQQRKRLMDAKSQETHSSRWRWFRATSWEQIEELMNFVEPSCNVYDKHGIVSRFPTRYRAYIGYVDLNKREGVDSHQVNAIAIAALLPKTRTVHIETFALHPRVRKLDLAHSAWKSWRQYLVDEWPETKETGESITIEVYLQNVVPWSKIMHVQTLETGGMKPQLIDDSTPVMLMGRALNQPAAQVYAEWQAFQRHWIEHRENTVMIRSKL